MAKRTTHEHETHEPSWLVDYLATTQREDRIMRDMLSKLAGLQADFRITYSDAERAYTVRVKDAKGSTGSATHANVVDAMSQAHNRYLEAWRKRKDEDVMRGGT